MADYLEVLGGFILAGVFTIAITGGGMQLLFAMFMGVVGQGIYEGYKCIEIHVMGLTGSCATVASLDDDLKVIMGAILGIYIFMEIPKAIIKWIINPGSERA